MSQNVYQFIDVNRVDPAKKPIKIRKIEFVEIYEPFTKQQAKAQADERQQHKRTQKQTRRNQQRENQRQWHTRMQEQARWPTCQNSPSNNSASWCNG